MYKNLQVNYARPMMRILSLLVLSNLLQINKEFIYDQFSYEMYFFLLKQIQAYKTHCSSNNITKKNG